MLHRLLVAFLAAPALATTLTPPQQPVAFHAPPVATHVRGAAAQLNLHFQAARKWQVARVARARELQQREDDDEAGFDFDPMPL